MLLGLMLLLAIAVSATALWYVSRPYAGPAFWMASGWTLILGVVGGNSDFLLGVYSTIAGLLPLQAIWLLLHSREDRATRPAQLLVGISLLLYSGVTLLRGYHGHHDWLLDRPYIPPHQSFSYLLPYNFALPALVMGFIGVTLMTMQRILAVSRDHEVRAQHLATRAAGVCR